MDLMAKAPTSLQSLQELLQQVALPKGRSSSTDYGDLLGGLALFSAGLLVGAGLGILFAPTSGERIRAEISDRLDEMRERVSSGSHSERSNANA